MPLPRLVLLFAGLMATLSVAFPVSAEPEIKPFYKGGFASPSELQEAVGRQTYRMEACDRGDKFEDARSVSVRLSKRGYERPGVTDAVLRNAAQFAWRECPRPYRTGVVGDFHYNVQNVTIYLPDGTPAIEANLGGFVHGDGAVASMRGAYAWQYVHNLYAAARQAEQAAAGAPAPQPAAEVESVGVDYAAQAQATFWGWVRVIAVLMGLGYAWLKRERLLYWYYSLTPHPAADTVHGAIQSGRELDGDAFAWLAKNRGDTAVERRVRDDQARQLTELWRQHEAALHAQEASLVEKERRRVREQSARLQAERDLLEAAIAHEQAAARVAELKRGDNDL